MDVLQLLQFLLLGTLIGILSGFFGIGGGIVLTPLLLVFGYEASAAIALSLMLTLGSTTAGTISHIRLRNVNVSHALWIGVFGIAGTWIATPLVFYLEGVDGATLIISLVYIALLSYFAISFFRSKQHVEGSAGADSVPRLGVIGVFAGFISSLMGVSGGFVLTPLQVKLLNTEMKRAVGTSISAALLIVISGVISYAVVGAETNYWHGIALIAGAMIGSPFGAKQLQRFSSQHVKKALGGFYLTVSVSVALNLIGWNTASLVLLVTLALLFIITLLVRPQKK
ncbi:sulfite exporter TauE/SafE family protein [Exiguobacterium qingdaonense]|uniref:sulfite exporter TauE/SafE family protein n=1 Tax=Exiguobacterium qingdaonense TaxID=2751251 RepID=UPI001BE6038F|nr:sulfite exporter TauE/SafE family protein [Exiguobacterium qingdaonense]